MLKRLLVTLALLLSIVVPPTFTTAAAQTSALPCEYVLDMPSICRSYLNSRETNRSPAHILILIVRYESTRDARVSVRDLITNMREKDDGQESELTGLNDAEYIDTAQWNMDGRNAILVAGIKGDIVISIRGVGTQEYSGRNLVSLYNDLYETLPTSADFSLDMLPAADDLTGRFELESEQLFNPSDVANGDDKAGRSEGNSSETSREESNESATLEKLDRQKTFDRINRANGESDDSASTAEATADANELYPGLSIVEFEVDDPYLNVVLQNGSDTDYELIHIELICEYREPGAPRLFLLLLEIGANETLLFENYLPLPEDCGDLELEFAEP